MSEGAFSACLGWDGGGSSGGVSCWRVGCRWRGWGGLAVAGCRWPGCWFPSVRGSARSPRFAGFLVRQERRGIGPPGCWSCSRAVVFLTSLSCLVEGVRPGTRRRRGASIFVQAAGGTGMETRRAVPAHAGVALYGVCVVHSEGVCA
jgi:hypothetical protein